MAEIYFVRHGQASFGSKNYDKLSDLGVEQAKLLGRYFKKLNLTFDAAYSGTLNRHLETAEAVLEEMGTGGENGLVVNPQFNEMSASDVTMSRLSDVIDQDPEIKRKLSHIHTDSDAIRKIFEIANDTEPNPVDEETRLKNTMAFIERVTAGITKVAANHGPGKKVVIFSSGGPMAATLRHVLEISREQTLRLGGEIKNSAYTVFRHDQKRLDLVMYNNTAHLELCNNPGLLTYI